MGWIAAILTSGPARKALGLMLGSFHHRPIPAQTPPRW